MKCPRDGTTLASVEILKLQLDKCPRCGGLWCDCGEMERLRDARIEGIEQVLERKYPDAAVHEGDTKAYMRCPRCEEARLLRHHYTYVNPVEVDRCESCSGVWLDAGELDAIIGEKARLEQEADLERLRTFLAAVARRAEEKKS